MPTSPVRKGRSDLPVITVLARKETPGDRGEHDDDQKIAACRHP